MKNNPAPLSPQQPQQQVADSWFDFSLVAQGLALKSIAQASTTKLATFAVYKLLFIGLFIYAIHTQTIHVSALNLSMLAACGVILLILSWIDLTTLRLPNILVLSLAFFGFCWVTLPMFLGYLPLTGRHLLNSGAGVLIGMGLFIGLDEAMRRLKGKNGMGMGDVKLLGALAMWVGATGLPLVLLFASFIALPVALASLVSGQRGKQIPFGPFLALGGWLTMLFQTPMWQALLFSSVQ